MSSRRESGATTLEIFPQTEYEQLLKNLTFPPTVKPLEFAVPLFLSCHILSENVTRKAYLEFKKLNSDIEKYIWFYEGLLLLECIYLTGPGPIYEAARVYGTTKFTRFGHAVRDAHPNVRFVSVGQYKQFDGRGDDQYPDFALNCNLLGRSNCIIVGEVAYSVNLSATHLKAQFYLQEADGIRGVIIIVIRNPWAVSADGLHYDVDNGSMLFLFYRRNGQINPTTHQVIPDFICSFGREPLALEEQTIVCNITGCNIKQIVGNVVGANQAIPCNADTQHLPLFNFEIPGELLYLVNPDDAFTITGQPLADVPFHLVFDLYDLQQDIDNGVELLNDRIDIGTEHVVDIASRYF